MPSISAEITANGDTEVGCEHNSSELFPPPAADTGTVMPVVGGNAREPHVAVDVSRQSRLPNANRFQTRWIERPTGSSISKETSRSF